MAVTFDAAETLQPNVSEGDDRGHKAKTHPSDQVGSA